MAFFAKRFPAILNFRQRCTTQSFRDSRGAAHPLISCRIAFDRQTGHDPGMPEKSISDRLDDCESIQESQQTELQKHAGRFQELEDGFRALIDAVEDLATATRQVGITTPAEGSALHRFRTGMAGLKERFKD